MDQNLSKVFIYGVFEEETRKCLYVGRTNNLERRKSHHIKKPNGKFYGRNDLYFLTLRELSSDPDCEIENKIISMYKSLGECEHNINLAKHNYSCGGVRIYFPELNIIFSSINATARYFGKCDTSISRLIRKNEKTIYGYKYELPDN